MQYFHAIKNSLAPEYGIQTFFKLAMKEAARFKEPFIC